MAPMDRDALRRGQGQPIIDDDSGLTTNKERGKAGNGEGFLKLSNVRRNGLIQGVNIRKQQARRKSVAAINIMQQAGLCCLLQYGK
ncbi:hypothetical protein KSF_005780 [Reticulibacter mediterranei]|uniref:Uncharacterized protein n=1 Tax=Reticulibacter mediterranei TaxID=2778369 RepID=A0A8J3IDN1_9CHLR|nr:hypothetical protein KSF_005780 [Reticulibacter mediterranei]